MSKMPSNPRVYVPGENPEEESPQDDIQSTKPFPLHCLPPAAQEMAVGICANTGVLASLSGPLVLGIMSASIGSGLEIRSGPVRTARANLYIVVSALSGTGKSEAMRQAAAPLYACEREDLASYNRITLPGAKAEVDLLNVEILALKNRAKKTLTQEDRGELQDDLRDRQAALLAAEAAMQAPVLTVEDVTTEKLAVLLSRRGETLASISPEAGCIVNNLLGRYNKLDRTDEGIYLKGWSGEPCKVDRQGRESIWLTRPCLSALWCVQPDKVESLLAVESLSDGGFLQRLLLCHSGGGLHKLNDEGRTEGTIAPTSGVAAGWTELVREIIGTFRKAEGEAQIVEPSRSATRSFISHYNAMVERWQTGELRDVTSFAVRWTENAWRIALCIHAG